MIAARMSPSAEVSPRSELTRSIHVGPLPRHRGFVTITPPGHGG
jgi:hypothetical protein